MDSSKTNINLEEPIPEVPFPVIPNEVRASLDEPLVNLEAEGFEVLTVYYAKMIPGAEVEAWARRSVAEMLHRAEALLPAGYGFVILDAWRPISVQQARSPSIPPRPSTSSPTRRSSGSTAATR